MSTLGNKQVMASNIRRYMAMMGIDRKEFCQRLGFKYSTVTDWLNAEKYPRIDKIEMMANFFNISKADLVEPPATAPPPNAIPMGTYTYKIPLLGKVAAGVPIYADEHIESYEYIDSRYKDDGFDYFALRVAGHSMEPTIQDGDIVVVRQQDTVDSGQIAIVLVGGEDATAKEVRVDEHGLTLVGHNVSAYSPQYYTNQQVAELPVRIIGLVIEFRRKLV